MLEVKVTVIGISPLLQDHMTDEVLECLRTGIRKPEPRDLPPKVVAERKLYRDEKGNLGLPSRMLFASLVGAGRKVKNGKAQISTAESSTLPALLEIREDFMVFNGYADKNWVVDMQRGRLDNGTAVCLVRPRFDKWGFDVTLEVDDGEVSEETIKQLVAVAGKKCGLGAYRPACKGQFGRFRIESWKSKKISA